MTCPPREPCRLGLWWVARLWAGSRGTSGVDLAAFGLFGALAAVPVATAPSLPREGEGQTESFEDWVFVERRYVRGYPEIPSAGKLAKSFGSPRLRKPWRLSLRRIRDFIWPRFLSGCAGRLGNRRF